jgi:hypothetical protein
MKYKVVDVTSSTSHQVETELNTCAADGWELLLMHEQGNGQHVSPSHGSSVRLIFKKAAETRAKNVLSRAKKVMAS